MDLKSVLNSATESESSQTPEPTNMSSGDFSIQVDQLPTSVVSDPTTLSNTSTSSQTDKEAAVVKENVLTSINQPDQTQQSTSTHTTPFQALLSKYNRPIKSPLASVINGPTPTLVSSIPQLSLSTPTPKQRILIPKADLLRGRLPTSNIKRNKLEEDRLWTLCVGSKNENIDPESYNDRKNRSNRGVKPERYQISDDESGLKTKRVVFRKRNIEKQLKAVKEANNVEISKDTHKDGAGNQKKRKRRLSESSSTSSKSNVTLADTVPSLKPGPSSSVTDKLILFPDSSQTLGADEIKDIKKGYTKEHKRPRGEVAQLAAQAAWFISMPSSRRSRNSIIVDSDDENHNEKEEPETKVEDKKEKKQRKKSGTEILATQKIKNESEVDKEAEERAALTLREQQAQLDKKKSEAHDNLKAEFKSKRLQRLIDEIERARRRSRKGTREEVKDYTSLTPVEDEFGCKDEYCPFLTTVVVGNHRQHIDSSKFFTEDITNGIVSQITSIPNLIDAKSLMTKQKKYYQYNKDHPPTKDVFELKSCIHPKMSEIYLTKEASRHHGLDPFLEAGRVMELVAESYVPSQYKKLIFNSQAPLQCISGRYAQALKSRQWNAIFKEIDEFNELITMIHQRGEFLPFLQSLQRFSRVTIHEILNQIYTRSVLPEANILRQYKGFSAEVYGELMPTFVSELFELTGLNSSSVFLDLGSGVGNVTLHAALEFGAESYGCELMENCTYLADKQLAEFVARSKLYGIKTGHVELLKGDFTENQRVQEVLPRCDVILVNNYLFDDKLNQMVLELMKTIKLGTKIVSLRPVVPDAYIYRAIDGDDLEYVSRLRVQKLQFRAGSVSWSNYIGDYYISELTDTIQVTQDKKNTRLQRNKTTITEVEVLTPITSDFEDICDDLHQEIKSGFEPRFTEDEIMIRLKEIEEKNEAERLRLEELEKIKTQKKIQKKKEIERKKALKLKKEQSAMLKLQDAVSNITTCDVPTNSMVVKLAVPTLMSSISSSSSSESTSIQTPTDANNELPILPEKAIEKIRIPQTTVNNMASTPSLLFLAVEKNSDVLQPDQATKDDVVNVLNKDIGQVETSNSVEFATSHNSVTDPTKVGTSLSIGPLTQVSNTQNSNLESMNLELESGLGLPDKPAGSGTTFITHIENKENVS